MTESPDRLHRIKIFLAANHFAGAQLTPLVADASFRRYIRVRQEDRVALLMDAPPEKENVRPYLAVAEYLHAKGYSTPAILGHDADAGLMLLEDLGDDLFTRLLRGVSGTALEDELYSAAIDVLAAWHDPARRLANSAALPLALYDEALLMQEVRLFSDWFLPQVVGKEQAAAMRDDYAGLWQGILSHAPLTTDLFVHRDYHADNLMWLPDRAGTKRVGLLDFQDGVYGDAAYDMVSLLEDARRDVPRSLADKMIARYIAATGADRARFSTAYAVLGAQRNSKIVGIFVRLAARDGKRAYLDYLPRVWRHLEHDLNHPALAALKAWTDAHIAPSFRQAVAIRYVAAELMGQS